MNILINTPDLSLAGGVANHYKGLLPYWSAKAHYNYVGGRKGIPGPLILPFDYVKFIFLCWLGKYEVILLNPSLNKTAIARDAVFLKIAVFFNKKCIVFWHGWQPQMVEEINQNPNWLRTKFIKATKHLVLSNSFKTNLINWGFNQPIELTTTKVDDGLLGNFDIQNKETKEFTILFLTRIEIYKGIFIMLEAFKTLVKTYPDLKLVIAGDGTQLIKAREFVNDNELKNVLFLGNVNGKQLIHAFEKSNLYVLPTFSEGMPTSVLEAMAFGLPVITRPVGGLNDFFENNKMGYLIESLEPNAYADKISHLIENPELIQQMSEYNHHYAKKHFMASKVAKQIEKIIESNG